MSCNPPYLYQFSFIFPPWRPKAAKVSKVKYFSLLTKYDLGIKGVKVKQGPLFEQSDNQIICLVKGKNNHALNLFLNITPRIIPQECTVVLNRATFEYSYSFSSIRRKPTNRPITLKSSCIWSMACFHQNRSI